MEPLQVYQHRQREKCSLAGQLTHRWSLVLELLQRLGLVTETDLGGGRVRYHPAEKGHHHHLICEQCGAVIDLDESVLAPLKDALLRQCNFVADLKHIGIFGRCLKCSQE